MKRLEGALLDEGVVGVGFVLASIGSERDTPERLARYAEDVRLDSERWTLGGPEAKGGSRPPSLILRVQLATVPSRKPNPPKQ